MRVKDCDFDENVSEGIAGGAGGAITVRFDSAAAIDNCRFRGNRCLHLPLATYGNLTNDGGAINVKTRSSANIRNCSFSGDYCGTAMFSQGGALSVSQQSHAHVFNCTFEDHTATLRGGAVFMDTYASVHFDQCTITGCTGGTPTALHANGAGGGAFYMGNSTSMLSENCIFENNTGESAAPITGGTFNGGGGVLLYGNQLMPASTQPSTVPVVFRNCLFLGNHGAPFGGVMCKQQDASTGRRPINFQFHNCTADANTSGAGGGFATMQGVDHTLTISATIIWDNVPNSIHVVNQSTQLNISYSCAGPVSATNQFFSGLNNNVNGPPVFAVGPKIDHYLGVGSPCIDAGPVSHTLPAAVLAVTTTSPTGAIDTGPIDQGYHAFVTAYVPVPLASSLSEAGFQLHFSATTPNQPRPLLAFMP